MLVNYDIPTILGSTDFSISGIIITGKRRGLQWLQAFDTHVVFHLRRLCQLSFSHPLTHIFSSLWKDMVSEYHQLRLLLNISLPLLVNQLSSVMEVCISGGSPVEFFN